MLIAPAIGRMRQTRIRKQEDSYTPRPGGAVARPGARQSARGLPRHARCGARLAARDVAGTCLAIGEDGRCHAVLEARTSSPFRIGWHGPGHIHFSRECLHSLPERTWPWANLGKMIPAGTPPCMAMRASVNTRRRVSAWAMRAIVKSAHDGVRAEYRDRPCEQGGDAPGHHPHDEAAPWRAARRTIGDGVPRSPAGRARAATAS